MDEELENIQNNSDTFTVRFLNKQDDLMSAIEVIDLCNREATRKSIRIMGVALVAYWSLQLVVHEPEFIFGWVMMVICVALGIFVWKEPRASNLKYTARYVQRASDGSAVIDDKQLVIVDGTGRDPFLFNSGLKVYEYKNVLAIDGGKKRFAMIPLDQLDENEREKLLHAIGEITNIEKVIPKQSRVGDEKLEKEQRPR